MTPENWNTLSLEIRRELWSFAEELALAGGQKTLEYFGREIGIDWKPDQSPVTIADRETELVMRAMISQRYPAHAIHGEEFGADLHGEYTWVLDPIDGTKSFINGVPLYCTLVALLHHGQPVIGVIVAPAHGEMVSGCIGLGTHDEAGNALQPVSGNGPQLRLYTSDFLGLERATPPWLQALCREYGPARTVARTWGDAYGYMLIATGRGDIMVDPELELWDVAPMHPILHESGCVLCDINGTPAQLPRSAAAMSRELHQRLFGAQPR